MDMAFEEDLRETVVTGLRIQSFENACQGIIFFGKDVFCVHFPNKVSTYQEFIYLFIQVAQIQVTTFSIRRSAGWAMLEMIGRDVMYKNGP